MRCLHVTQRVCVLVVAGVETIFFIVAGKVPCLLENVGILVEDCLGICMYILKFYRQLMLWFICYIADIDSDHTLIAG